MCNKVLVISEDTVKELLSIEDAMKAVEDVLHEKAHHRVQMPPKTYIYFKQYNGDFRTMPSYIQGTDKAGVKIVNVHPNNPLKHQKPVVMATIVLIDPHTGAPLSILGATTITAMRTGAIGGIATKYLARKTATTLGLVGAGTQARMQLTAISKILPLEQVRIYDKFPNKVHKFIEHFQPHYNFTFVPCENLEDCVKDTDVISTVTPVTTPIVKNAWISAGTHINAIGADAPGKEELDPKILKRAKIVVDDYEQATHSGEINVPLSQGYLTLDNIHGELSEVVAHKIAGRESSDEITVFDSTGLSLQDIATASVVFDRAKQSNRGQWIQL
jgi:alanine dehydrogenase